MTTPVRLLVAGLLLAPLIACGTNPSTGPAISLAPTTAGSTTAPISAVPSGRSGTSGGGPTSASGSASGPPTVTPSAPPCAELVGRLSRREQIGQLFMVGVPTSALTSSTARTLSTSRAGSVILLGTTHAGRSGVRRLVGEIRAATRRPAGVQTMLAADQEGGLVQRLQGPGFADIPSARTQGSWPADRLRTSAKQWGADLRAAGIDADLAPVADVVPAKLTEVNQPIGVLRRGYGSDPAVVAGHTAAFVAGMDAAGVATSAKHFPGLGRVRGNTDLVTRVVDPTTTRHAPDLAGFRSAVGAGVDMVMVSSAYYARIDPNRRAAYSPTVIGGMLRGDLGFDGVVISDDLAAAGAADLPTGTRAVGFLRAGGDLVIVGDPTQLSAMVDAVSKQAADDAAFDRTVTEAARRVLALKAHRGLASC